MMAPPALAGDLARLQVGSSTVSADHRGEALRGVLQHLSGPVHLITGGRRLLTEDTYLGVGLVDLEGQLVELLNQVLELLGLELCDVERNSRLVEFRVRASQRLRGD